MCSKVPCTDESVKQLLAQLNTVDMVSRAMDGCKSEFAEKLDKELEDYISSLKPRKCNESWPEDKWEEEMVKHPFFMEKPLSEGEEVPPLVEALQQLKYDPNENTPEELALAHKEDGNQYFKAKKYRWAVEAYTEGLKQNCEDKVLVSQLLANRAAAHFHIGNYKKSLKDASEAKSIQPGYMKAIHRGALCCLQLKQFDDCVSWCEEGLQHSPSNPELESLKTKAVKEKKIAERDKRKAASKASKKEKELQLLEKVLADRGMCLKAKDGSDLSELLKPEHPDLSDFMVHLDDSGCLVWPVLLLYPEYGLTDCIQQFHEDTCFADHFREMFAECNRPSWDEEGKYRPDNLQVYFGCDSSENIVSVDPAETLRSVLGDKRFKLCAGTPTFFVTAKGSKFDDFFKKRGQN